MAAINGQGDQLRQPQVIRVDQLLGGGGGGWVIARQFLCLGHLHLNHMGIQVRCIPVPWDAKFQ